MQTRGAWWAALACAIACNRPLPPNALETPAATVVLEGDVSTHDQMAVPGATVCAGPGRCVVATGWGGYQLSVPAHDEIAITVSAPGFRGSLLPLANVGHHVGPLNLGLDPDDDDQAQERATALGVRWPDEETGTLLVVITDQGNTGLQGVTMELQPRSGRGPVYFSDDLPAKPDPKLTSTSIMGAAFFAGVKPGTVTLSFGSPSMTCAPQRAGWPSGPHAVRAPIAAGFDTVVDVRCHR